MDKDLCVLGPVSSLLLWRASRCGLIDLSQPDEMQPDLSHCHARIRDMRQLDLVRMLGNVPLDAIVGDRAKSHSGTLHTIVLAGKMPPGSFVRVGQGLCACSPELCFALLGRGGQVIRLAEFGLELCGTYAIMPDQSGRSCACSALTDGKRLSAYVDLLGHRHGLAVARKVLRLVTEGSGSPRETSLFLALTAPARLGGYGLRRPELNAKVGVLQRTSTVSTPKACVASQLYRDDRGKKVLAVDSCGMGALSKPQCREALEGDGIDVVDITLTDTMSMSKLEAKALRVARLLGEPVRPSKGLLLQRRSELFGLLFGESRWNVEHEVLCQLAGYGRPISRKRRVA